MVSRANKRRNQGGFIVSFELLLIATILVIGLVVGMVTIRDAAITEMADMSEAIGAMNQGYSFDGVVNSASTAQAMGSELNDESDGGVGFLIDTQDGDATAEFAWVPAINEDIAPTI